MCEVVYYKSNHARAFLSVEWREKDRRHEHFFFFFLFFFVVQRQTPAADREEGGSTEEGETEDEFGT